VFCGMFDLFFFFIFMLNKEFLCGTFYFIAVVRIFSFNLDFT
jgi:hypothetical protein